MTPQGGSLTDLPGLRVGHATTGDGRSGVTVIVFDRPSPLHVDLRGGAPSTRETAAFFGVGSEPLADGLVFCGGSNFGLAAVDGVVAAMAADGRGKRTAGGPVPRVPGAVIYDLVYATCRPDAQLGEQAYRAAGQASQRGNVGAGAGATVGKVRGAAGWMKGGLGMASRLLPDGTTVAALAVVNAFGDVHDPVTGRIVAGARDQAGRPLELAARLLDDASLPLPDEPFDNTVLVAIASDLAIAPSERPLLTQAAHDGLADAIRPAHTAYDGDAVVLLPLGSRPGSLLRATAGVRAVTAAAIVDAVLAARAPDD